LRNLAALNAASFLLALLKGAVICFLRTGLSSFARASFLAFALAMALERRFIFYWLAQGSYFGSSTVLSSFALRAFLAFALAMALATRVVIALMRGSI